MIAIATVFVAVLKVGVYAPFVYFEDVEKKADFLSKVEAGLVDATGGEVRAQQLRGLAEAKKQDVLIVGGEVSRFLPGFRIVAIGRVENTSGRFYLVSTTKDAPLARSGKLLSEVWIPGERRFSDPVFRRWVLWGEPLSYRARYVRDSRSVAAAVGAGEAGLGLVSLPPAVAKGLGSHLRIVALAQSPPPVLMAKESVLGELSTAFPAIPGVVDDWVPFTRGHPEFSSFLGALAVGSSDLREPYMERPPKVELRPEDFLPSPNKPGGFGPFFLYETRFGRPKPRIDIPFEVEHVL